MYYLTVNHTKLFKKKSTAGADYYQHIPFFQDSL